MTHAEIVDVAAAWLRRDSKPGDPVMRKLLGLSPADHVPYESRYSMRACGVVLTEPPGTGEEPDAIGWSGGAFAHVIECKVSRRDFLRDQKKRHRSRPGSGLGFYRWYMAPAGLLEPDELPEGWGLLEVRGKGRVTVAKLAASQPDRNLRGEVEILVCHQRMLAIALRGGRLRDTRRTRRVVEQLARIVDRGEPPPLERVLGARVTGWAEFAHNGTGVREWRVSRT